MRQGDSLKSYIGFFQSQLAKVLSCDEDVSALTFIRGLQVSHPLYKHLLKYDVTGISNVLSRAKPYIQLDEARKISSNHSAKPGDHEGKSVSARILHPCPRSEPGITCLQETSALDSHAELAPSLQAHRAIHSAQALHQLSFQHHQGSTLGQASETHQYDPLHPE